MAIDKNGKIILETVIIDERNIIVLGSSTSFVNQTFINKINVGDIKKTVATISAIAKNKGAKFKGRNKTLKTLNETIELYEIEYVKYINLFKQLKTLAENKVKKGIFTPTCDDLELFEMYDIRNKIFELFHANKPMSILRNIKTSVERAEDFIKTSNNPVMVSISEH